MIFPIELYIWSESSVNKGNYSSRKARMDLKQLKSKNNL